MGKIVYIMSDNRSGSTLLDQLLGAHPQMMSLGEVHHLPAYELQDRRLYDPIHPLICSCGSPLPLCPFWTDVARRLGRPLASLNLTLAHFDRMDDASKVRRAVAHTCRRFITRYPGFISRPIGSWICRAKTVGRDSHDLYDAVFMSTQADLLIDSSKSPLRFRAIYDYRPDSVLCILLGRDYRGTVHSKMKRGRPLETSVKDWVRRMVQMKACTAGIPLERHIRVRYEDLCNDPRAELTRICNFLHVDFAETMLSRPSDDVHHLGGSPSKFDPSRKIIKPDQSHLGSFSDEELAIMRDIVKGVAPEWGYT